MNIQPYFELTSDKIRTHRTIISQSECQFQIGRKIFDVKPHQARMIAFIMQAQSQNFGHEGMSAQLGASMLGYSRPSSFRRAFNSLMKTLDNFVVANEGGTGSIFFEETVTAADLFLSDDGENGYRYNEPLAKRVPLGKPEIEEKELYEVQKELASRYTP